MAYAPTQGDTARFNALEKSVIRPSLQNPERGGGKEAQTNRFPTGYTPVDPYDSRYDLKNQVITHGYYGQPNAAGKLDKPLVPQLTVPLTDQDFAYVDRKKKSAEYALFTKWCEQWINWKDPANVALYEQMIPEYFQRRYDTIDMMHMDSAKMAKLVMRGPRSREELEFLWMVSTGKLPIFGELWNPSTFTHDGLPKATSDKMSPKYAYFNPWYMVSKDDAPRIPADGNYTNAWGSAQMGAPVMDAGIQDIDGLSSFAGYPVRYAMPIPVIKAAGTF